MSDKTGIEWTDATWNPIVGCSIVSPGCTNCYAMKMAARIERMGTAPHYAGLTRTVNGKPVWTGTLRQAPESILTQPLRWKKPRRIFVNSMSDLFHEDVPDAWIDQVFAIMALAPQHVFQVLTKRPERMREYLTKRADPNHSFPEDVARRIGTAAWALAPQEGWKAGLDDLSRWPLPNVWLGTSVEDQPRADERIPHLLTTPAAIRFISAEPLLGPVDLTRLDINGDSEMDALRPRSWSTEVESWRGTEAEGVWQESFLDWFGLSELPTSGDMHRTLDWVIVGGESGPGARPMHPDWARSLRDQCAAAGVPFFFKQWGEWTPGENVGRSSGTIDTATWFDGEWHRASENLALTEHRDDEPDLYAVGKAAAGRLLDGAAHDETPS